MRRLLLFCLLVSAVAAPIPAATVPSGWKMQDLSVAPARIYAVEVARFPSDLLARGVSDALAEEGWAPLSRQKNDDGSIGVLLGQTGNIGEAWFIQRELAGAGVVHGEIVRLRNVQGDIPIEGPVTPAFRADYKKSDQEKASELRAMLAQVDAMDTELTAANDEFQAMRQMIDAGDVRDPAVARGAVATAALLWKLRLAPDAVKYFAGKVASSEWPAAANEQNLRYRAEDLYFDVVYGIDKDWVGSWRVARRMELSSPAVPARIAASQVRQAALLITLIEEDNDPLPRLNIVRGLVREAYSRAPEEATRLRARADYLYLETFTWEGDWARVEDLSRGFHGRNPEEPGYAAMADILLARSLERKSQFETSIALLDDVIATEIHLDKRLRYGMTIVDPSEVARQWRRHFEDLILADKAIKSEIKYQTTTAPANDPEPAPEPTPLAEPPAEATPPNG